MRLTLVSDSLSSISAAAVNVAAGYYSDFLDYPGIAHFVEHLLFMGTEKYPVMNYADEVVTASGGYISAYTDNEVTNYYMFVSNDFWHALDVLAQFFVHPLMKVEAVEKEINAVESEYRKGLTDDLWSAHQLQRHLCNNKSAFNGLVIIMF